MDPLKGLRDRSRLITLNLTYEMPIQVRICDLRDLRYRLLQIILAKIALAQRRRRADRFSRLLLTNCQQVDRPRVPPVSQCSGFDALSGISQSFRQLIEGRGL
jgi:hypothetical protein